MKYQDYFIDKKVTVMGLGLLGRGVGDIKYIAAAGAREVVVTDLKTAEELASSVQELLPYPNVTFVLGEHREEDFKNCDLVLKAAGVPLDSPYILAAKAAQIPVVMSGALFAALSGVPVIGVTGTRGKSTVTHMIHHVLSVTTEGGPVLLGGNVRGVSNLQLLGSVTPEAVAVMELDSWQLQGFGDLGISPQISVFTSFMPDHLNYYEAGGRSREEALQQYFVDKAQIFLHQEESGVLVTTPEVFSLIKDYVPTATLGQEVILADVSVLPEDMLLSMPGAHNRLNAALATLALQATGLTEEEIFTGLASFPGVPGRLEYVGEKDGVKIYNDNNATTPEATAAGLSALGRDKNIVLIMGGSAKNIDPAPLLEAIEQYTKAVVLLPGTGTDTIKDRVNGTIVSTLEEAVTTALSLGKPGDVLLFSPAFASFGMFKNEYERNDAFMKLVTDYEVE